MSRRVSANSAWNDAEFAAIQQSPATLDLPDLGESMHHAVSKTRPCTMECNALRAAMRIEATLLLREQTVLIREARSRVAAGLPLEPRDSVVLPHVGWELTFDPEKYGVRTRLVNAPWWITRNSEEVPAEFWTIPLDGSVAWQFHRPKNTTSR
jgi:hypothetical protein